MSHVAANASDMIFAK